MMSELSPSHDTTVHTSRTRSLSPRRAFSEVLGLLMRQPQWLVIFALLLSLLVQPTLWLKSTWFDLHSPFFAQPLVLLGAFLIGYSRRTVIEKTAQELATLFPASSPKRRGNIVGIILGGVVALLGHLLKTDFIAILGFVVVLTGVVFYFYGPFILRNLFPALFFLCFLIPLPKTLTNIYQIGFQNGTYSMLSPFFKTNSFTIEVPNFIMPIDALASGLHIFIPCTIFCIGWALYKGYRFYNIAIMLVLAVLLSLLINVLRIMVICWLGSANPDFGDFLSHSTPILLVIPIAWIITRVAHVLHRREELRISMRSSVS
jgi:hypothetical protein